MSFLPAALLLLTAAQGAPRDACVRDANAPRCGEERARRLERLYGTRPIETYRDAGAQVRRIYYNDGRGDDVAVISFIWPRGGDPLVTVQFPVRNGETPPPPLQAAVPAEIWQDLLARSANFDRTVLPRPDPPGVVSICLHPWSFTVEASDPDAGEGEPKIRRRIEGCEDGFAAAFGREAQQIALPLFPVCAQLIHRQYRGTVHRLAMCARLEGDRTTAAEALNRANEMIEVNHETGVSDLRRLFEPLVVVEWDGERATGGTAGATLWATKALQHPTFFFATGARGEDRDTVRVTGYLRRFIQPAQGDPWYERAPVVQLWRRRSGRFAMASATVGAFVPGP